MMLLINHCIYLPLQVEPSASNLNTNDVFVLKSQDSVFVWKGAGASEEEMVAAKYVVTVLGQKSTDVAEGKEPGESPACFLLEV